MKFTYDTKQDARECVAYIDEDGDLRMKTDEGVVYMYKDNSTPSQNYSHEFWDPYDAIHRFYTGDKITIEF